jgi:predicted enzyme related to lactoylglutathione lyase
LIPCILINYDLYSISHEEIKRDGNGEREMPTIVHFDIPSDDIERSKKFYNELFGWKFDKWSGSEAMPEGMEYWLISTVDDKGNKALGGGMMKRQSPQQQGITNYFDVKSVQEYSARVEQLGVKVISPKMPVPGMGYIATCTDTENNGFGIFEADQTAK